MTQLKAIRSDAYARPTWTVYRGGAAVGHITPSIDGAYGGRFAWSVNGGEVTGVSDSYSGALDAMRRALG